MDRSGELNTEFSRALHRPIIVPADPFEHLQAGNGQSLFGHGVQQAAVQGVGQFGADMQFRAVGAQGSGSLAVPGRFRPGHKAQAEFRRRIGMGGQQAVHGVFGRFKGGQGFQCGRQAVGEAGEQAGAGMLIRPIQSNPGGQPADVVFVEPGFGQGRTHLQLFKGASPGPVIVPVGKVGAVAKHGRVPGKSRMARAGLAQGDEEKALAWLAKGAQPTDTVKSLFSKDGIMKKWDEVKRSKKEA